MSILREFRNASPSEKDPAKLILFTVFADLNARHGFGDFWSGINNDIKEEILKTNLEKIREILKKKTQTKNKD